MMGLRFGNTADTGLIEAIQDVKSFTWRRRPRKCHNNNGRGGLCEWTADLI
jgi:hypothetical protein